MQHRDEGIARYPGFWGFFGGACETGETPEQAMARETKEELNIEIVGYHLALERAFTDDAGVQRHMWIFVAPFEIQQILRLSEGQGMGWFFPDDFSALDLAPFDREVLLEIVKSE